MKSLTRPNQLDKARSLDQLGTARSLAHLLDSAFVLPGTKVRIGLDALLGLLPVVGDLISSAAGAYVVLIASQLGVSRLVLARMSLNLAIDTLLGAIPLVGDLFDVMWRANVRNVALLERALDDPQTTRRESMGILIGLGFVVLLLLAGVVVLGAWLLSL